MISVRSAGKISPKDSKIFETDTDRSIVSKIEPKNEISFQNF